MKLLNAFSLNMVADGTLHIRAITASHAAQLLADHGLESCVGHDPALISRALGMPVGESRRSIALAPDERAIVAQYIGPRLPQGSTELPPEAKLTFKLIHWTADALPDRL